MNKENYLFYEDMESYKDKLKAFMNLFYILTGLLVIITIISILVFKDQAKKMTTVDYVAMTIPLALAIFINIYVKKSARLKYYTAITAEKILYMYKKLHQYEIADIAKCAVVKENTRSSKVLITLNDDKAWLLTVRDAEKFKSVLDGLLAAKEVPSKTDADPSNATIKQ
jgi:K+ transporter